MPVKAPILRKPEGAVLAGLTGGIASGKSLATAEFKKLGAFVVDADESARKVVIPGSPGLKGIVDLFGRDVITTAGLLDRKKLADLVFQYGRRRKQLEALLHPLIMKHEFAQLDLAWKRGQRGVFVVSAALMVEAGSYKRYDHLTVVWCTKAQQMARLRKRDKLSQKEAAARLDAQMPLSEKRKLAAFVIENTGTPAEAKKQVRALYKAWKKEAEAS